MFSDTHIIGILLLDGDEIIGISIHPFFRRRKFGRSLILHAAKTLNLSILTTETDEDAIAFYRSCGFECMRFERTFPDGICIRYNCILKIS